MLELCDSNSKETKVIPFERKPDGTERELLKALEFNRNNDLEELVLVYTIKGKPSSTHHWFAKSTLKAMGMITRMIHEMNRWCNGERED